MKKWIWPSVAIGFMVVFLMGSPFWKAKLQTESLTDQNTDSQPYVQAIIRHAAGSVAFPHTIKPVVCDYFNRNYCALFALKSIDLIDLFDISTDMTLKNYYLNQAVLDYQVKLRNAQPINLTMQSCIYGLTCIENQKLAGDDIRVVIMEDLSVSFMHSGTISHSSGIRHTFLLGHDKNGQYKIRSHEKNEDVWYLFVEQLEKKEEAGILAPRLHKRLANQIQSELLSEAAGHIWQQTLLRGRYYTRPEQYRSIKNADNPYNRRQAVAYSYQWVDPILTIRNNRWRSYDAMGGNCNNFISQCIHAGGIPMDHHGDWKRQWKWYGDDIVYGQEAQGRSPSWTGVGEFYQYCLLNTGFGMVASPSRNLYAGEPGDIIQFGAAGRWRHSVIITRIVTDEKGRVVDYLVNSNTTDRMDYPMSAYPYTDIRLIKISGWNHGL